jgi:hypothetical protein
MKLKARLNAIKLGSREWQIQKPAKSMTIQLVLKTMHVSSFTIRHVIDRQLMETITRVLLFSKICMKKWIFT